ncbi:MAG: acriflavine resistance protein B [Chlamydiae bacterium]|nr:MAG: acriflavine resistance protein B [Chlamydiota bacterium]
MNLSNTFIKKPVMTVLVMICVFAFGLAAYFKLPVSDLPVVDYPVMQITCSYPGASPATMATTVATPLENECTQINGLQSLISQNTEGQTTITLTFDLDRTVDLAAPDVQAAISRAMSNLPDDLPNPPTYNKNNPSEDPILYVVVISESLSQGELYDYGNKRIAQQISMAGGVSRVQVYGAKTAIRIQVDPNKLASYKIGIEEVAEALDTGTVMIPGGSLDGKLRTFTIEPKGQLTKASEYKNLIVAYRNNAPVFLGNIATCVDGTDNDVVQVNYAEGKKIHAGTVMLAIYREDGANTVALSKRIRKILDDLKEQMPGSVKVDVMYDRSVQIIGSIKDVQTTIFIAFCLVVMVIFIFLGRLSDTVIPGIALPLSIIATFAVMSLLGFSLDNLSLMALTLAVGFVVDDAIVVLENSVRLVDSGMKPLDAAIQSVKEISGTVVSMTLALVTVFIPLVFMGGVVGRVFREFAVTVIAAIVCSGILSLTLTPMMCARMLKKAEKEKTKLQKFADKFIGGMKNIYAGLLHWTLKHRFIVILIWLVCIGGTFFFMSLLPKTFIPTGDSGCITGEILMKQGTSTDQIKEFQNQINSIITNNPNVAKMCTVSGANQGADQTLGYIYVILKPQDQREPIEKVVQQLSKEFATYPNGLVFLEALPALQISTGGDSTAAGSKYSYTMKSADRDDLYNRAIDLEQKMRTMPEFAGVQSSVKLNMPQLNVKILRDRASTLGITAGVIERTLLHCFAQGKLTTYHTDIDQYDVIIELAKEYQKEPKNLSRIYLISSLTGKLVPLESVVQIKETVGPQNVPHSDQLDSATISFNLAPGIAIGEATKALQKVANKILPNTITGEFEGEAQEFQQSVASMGILVIIAVFVLYVILGILYENYTHPITVLTTLPVAAFGGMLTLFVFKSELSLYAYVGVFMLLGIVAKNGIMMIERANQNLEKGNTTDFDAIYEACLTRFRPILMTGIAAIMGAVPIALGFGADGASRRPLGLIVVGGLLFSQVITLFVTPGIFLYMQKLQNKLNKYEMFRAGSVRKDND